MISQLIMIYNLKIKILIWQFIIKKLIFDIKNYFYFIYLIDVFKNFVLLFIHFNCFEFLGKS